MDWKLWVQAALYAVAMLALLGGAVRYGLVKWMPKHLRACISEQDVPLWRRYQTLWCLVLAAAAGGFARHGNFFTRCVSRAG